MADEYDPETFAIRVSQRLFNGLSGRAVEPGPIEARNRREAALIEAVRKEGRRDKMQLLRNVKEDAVKAAHVREQAVYASFSNQSAALDDKLNALRMPVQMEDNAAAPPCQKFRNAVTDCYKLHADDNNVLECAKHVHAFTECAKQLCDVSTK